MSDEASEQLDDPFFYPREVAVGIDLGQSKDPTSIAVVESITPTIPHHHVRAMQQTPWGRRALAAIVAKRPPATFNLRLLQQAPLGEPYPAQAARIKQILAAPTLAEHDPRVYMDFTGVGRPMFDIMRREGIPRLVPITITFQGGGANAAGGRSVAKLELVSRLQALMHTGALRMPDSLPLARTFRRELQEFRVSYTPVGNATFGAREGAHDDLVLSVALAVWGLTQPKVTAEPLRL